MKTAQKSQSYSFVPFNIFIEYKKKLTELKTSLHITKMSINEARKILDRYVNPTHKLSSDVLHMREE